jgi:parallel beta-helix repeat protein
MVQKTRALILFFTLMFSVFTVFSYVESSEAGGNTIYVDDSGGKEYRSIQAAIDAASDGDTIFVYNGTYYEHIIVNKKISLIGENKDTAILDGNYEEKTIMNVIADNVTIQKFTLKNCSKRQDDTAGIKTFSNCSISNCIFLNNDLGIYIYSKRNNSISGCDFSTNYFGILNTNSNHNTITNCNFFSNKIQGIALNVNSNYNKIINCSFYDNDDGLWLFNANSNLISNCTFFKNNGGIEFFEPEGPVSFRQGENSQNIILNCIITNNTERGIYFTYLSKNNYILNCTITGNKKGILIEHSGENNIISHCNMSNNEDSIWITETSYSHISENFIGDNTHFSICLEQATNTTITSNALMSNGISLLGNSLFHYKTHKIENNTINGKPIRYYKDTSNIVVPTDTGQVIIVNCTNFSIKNLNFSKVEEGIKIVYSSVNTINNNTINNNLVGISLLNSTDNLIFSNNINGSDYGITLDSSLKNKIYENDITNNKCGISISYDSKNNDISNNYYQDNDMNIWDGSSYGRDYVGTPGFELIFVFCAIALIFFLKRKRIS